MKVLLLGATGHLGGHLAVRLPAAFPTSVAPRLDIADATALDRFVRDTAPAVIVNAIGAPTSADPTTLRRVNTEFPHGLARVASAHHSRVVHISSDAVFSGARGRYTEADAADPSDEYGRSKHGGELAAPHLTIRTSFFGRNRRGAGLIEWLVAARGSVDGFADYWFTGVSTAILADLIVDAIRAGLEGTWHVGGEAVNKYELLVAAATQLHVDVQVTPVRRGRIDRTLESAAFFSAVGRAQPTIAQSLATLACAS